MVPELQAWAVGMAVEGAEGEEEDLAAATSMEAVVMEDMAATTTTMATGVGAVDLMANATFATRPATSAAAAGGVEGIEEPATVGKVTLHSLDFWVIDSGATYSMTPRADLLTELEPSPIKHVTSALGQRAEVKGMGKAMFKGADGKMVGLKNVLWVPNLAANLISVRRLQKAGMDTSSKGSKTYTARLGERKLWDLHEDRDIYNEMWQIPVVPMPKERQVAASISTKSEAVGGGDHGKQSDSKSDSNDKGWLLWDPFTKKFLVSRDCKFMENLPYKEWKAENQAKIGVRLGEVKSTGLEHVELPLELSSSSTITRQSTQMNGGEEEEEVQQGDERAPSLPPRATSARGNRADLQQRHESIQVPAVEEEGRGRRKTQPPNRLSYERLGGAANSTLTGSALMLGDEAEDESEECAFAFFSPGTTLRTLFAAATIKGWVVKQMDIVTAFLNGVLEEETYMEQPEGYNDGSGRVWKLKKALYGLKQAPRQWYIKLREVLEAIGFTPSTADQSLFMLGEGEQRSFMVVYVDDILIFSPSSDLVKEVMLKLQDKFKCKTLGDVNYYLGLHIERDVEKRWMRVHQKKYLEALAANFGKSEGHVATPLPSGFKCVKGPAEESVGEEERRRFHSLVGSLIACVCV
ncbi:hypothetical protein CLOM_g19771 [Closterium sp. NIES-68]|nr:hypothetical protein CLOM_g19771 [Closterium sp. NIES-68]